MAACDFQYEGRGRVLRLSPGIPPGVSPDASPCLEAKRHERGRRVRMTRAATWALSAGALLFIGWLVSQGLPAVVATLALAGWGLLLVALFHLLPLVLDAVAIRVLFDAVPGAAAAVGAASGSMR